MVTMENQEVASDQLKIDGYEGYGAQDYTLAACQPAFNSALRDGSASASTSGSTGEAPWWTGDEPLYYIVSPKVGAHSSSVRVRSSSRDLLSLHCRSHAAMVQALVYEQRLQSIRDLQPQWLAVGASGAEIPAAVGLGLLRTAQPEAFPG